MNREIPRGFRDFLPDEVIIRRGLESKLASLYSGYGYREIIPPAAEFLHTIEAGTGNRIRRELFMLLDKEGEILALRPEMTVSIARMAATHLADEPLPQRYFYSGQVFRNIEPHLAQHREFWQMGVEMIGSASSRADAEIISLAAASLQVLDVREFQISLNHIGIFKSLLKGLELQESDSQQIMKLVESKDLVELERLLERVPGEDSLKASIATMPVSHGGPEILDRLEGIENNREASQAALDLIRVYELLCVYGLGDRVVVDTGVLRNLDYYTGVVFEGYSADLGYGLLGGGRYDRLLGQFGFDCPATGFAIGMDRLALVSRAEPDSPERFLVGGPDPARVMARAEEYRLQGCVVEMDVEGASRQELESKILAKKHFKLCYID